MIEPDFTQWLMYYHTETHPELLDDDLPDAFDNWLSELDGDDYINLAQEWGDERVKDALDQKS